MQLTGEIEIVYIIWLYGWDRCWFGIFHWFISSILHDGCEWGWL